MGILVGIVLIILGVTSITKQFYTATDWIIPSLSGRPAQIVGVILILAGILCVLADFGF